MASVVVFLFTGIFMLGVGLGWWVRSQLALAAAAMEAASSQQKKAGMPSDQELEARGAATQAELNRKLRSMGLPYVEDK